MNRAEFEQLRDLPDKQIKGNVTFSSPRGSRPIYVLDPLPVQNSLKVDLVLQGSYNSQINKLTVQFLVRGVGPICRFCINGRVHRNTGRTHKHDLHKEDDPSRNIPEAIARPELYGPPLTIVWETICSQAGIEHEGLFQLPAGGVE